MMPSSLLHLGVVYTIAMFLVFSLMSETPVSAQDNAYNDPTPTSPLPPPSADGTPGIPGIPGLHGSQGTKGDTGSPGSQGSKGEPGTPYIPPPLSAFQVQRSSNLQVTSGYQTVDFDSTKLDLGNDISPTSGVFRCRIPGLYNFAFSGYVSILSKKVMIYLMHNDHHEAYAYAAPGSGNADFTASLNVILALDRDDEVYLRAYATTYLRGAGNHGRNNFSGYLIYEI